MFINFGAAHKAGYSPDEVLTLFLVKYISVKANDPKGEILEIVKKRDIRTLFHLIEAREDHIRLNSMGTEVFNKILTAATSEDTTEEDQAILDWITEYCTKSEKLVTGNKKQLLRNITDLRLHSDLSSKQIFIAMQHFLESTDAEYFNMFQYLFWKPSGAYNKKFSLENSRLYNYIEKNKEELEKLW